MKKIIIISLCLLFANTIKGQEFIPMPTDSAEWVYRGYSVNSGSYTETWYNRSTLLGDTIIDNKTFFKYGNKNSNIASCFLYYEDKKVYWLNNINSSSSTSVKNDTTLRLLYNFGMNQGDTIIYPYFLGNETIENEIAYVLDTITLISTNIGVRKKFEFSVYFLSGPEYATQSVYWIEGIGSNKSLAFLNNSLAFNPLYGSDVNIACFTHHNVEILGYNCSILNIDNNINNDKLELFPNPFVDNFQMIIPENFSPYGYSIYDVNGKIIKSEFISEFDKTISINANTFKKGTYFIVLSDGKGNMLKKVIVKN